MRRNLIFAGTFNLLYLFHFDFGALVIFRVLQKLSIVLETDTYYILPVSTKNNYYREW